MGTNPQFAADLVTFTEEILDGKLHFLCSVFPLNPLNPTVYNDKLKVLLQFIKSHKTFICIAQKHNKSDLF